MSNYSYSFNYFSCILMGEEKICSNHEQELGNIVYKKLKNYISKDVTNFYLINSGEFINVCEQALKKLLQEIKDIKINVFKINFNPLVPATELFNNISNLKYGLIYANNCNNNYFNVLDELNLYCNTNYLTNCLFEIEQDYFSKISHFSL